MGYQLRAYVHSKPSGAVNEYFSGLQKALPLILGGHMALMKSLKSRKPLTLEANMSSIKHA